MEPQAYKVIQEIYAMLTKARGQAAHLTDADIAYISGLVKTLLTVYGEAEPVLPAPSPSFTDRIINKITPNERH